ncbi:MAG: hypothetical protein P9L99_18205 [Candidatus Lernaella stagnicola]|nr:hypothetical protein [Candidatus Lernaella stagnicola]
MQKWSVVIAIGLLAAWAAAAGPPFDLVAGHGLSTDPPARGVGFRVVQAGETKLHVEPLDGSRARLVFPDGNEEIVTLPAVGPLREEPRKPVAPPPLRFVSEDFTTFLDAVSLLLAPAAARLEKPWNWTVRVRAATAVGRVGRAHVTGSLVHHHFPDMKIDNRLQALIDHDPFPPLAHGDAVFDVSLSVLPRPYPVLSVWISRPYYEDEGCGETPLTAGRLFQRPLQLPPRVADAVAAREVVDSYRRQQLAARRELVAWLDAENTPPLYGHWRVDSEPAWQLTCRALADAPAGQSEALLYLGALTLAHQRRLDQAGRWLERAIATGEDPQTVAAAKLLLAQWRHEALWPSNDPASTAAADHDRGRLWRKAQILAGSVINAQGELDVALLRGEPWSRDPETPLVLFDAAMHLLNRDRSGAAAACFALLVNDYGDSPLALEALWGQLNALRRAGRDDHAVALAMQWAKKPLSRSAKPVDSPPWLRLVEHRLRDDWGQSLRLSRFARDTALDAYLRDGGAERLDQARASAEFVTGRDGAFGANAADWLALGDLRKLADDVAGTRAAYRHAAQIAARDDLRTRALCRLADTFAPSARRVASRLAGDSKWGGLLAPITPEQCEKNEP